MCLEDWFCAIGLYYIPPVMYYISPVTYYVSSVTYYISSVTYYMILQASSQTVLDGRRLLRWCCSLNHVDEAGVAIHISDTRPQKTECKHQTLVCFNINTDLYVILAVHLQLTTEHSFCPRIHQW